MKEMKLKNVREIIKQDYVKQQDYMKENNEDMGVSLELFKEYLKKNVIMTQNEIINTIQQEFESSAKTLQRKQDAYAIARLAISQMKNKEAIKRILNILLKNGWIKLTPLGKQLKELGFKANEELINFFIQNDMQQLVDGLTGMINSYNKKKLDTFELNRIIKSFDVKRFKEIEKELSNDMLDRALLLSIGEGDSNKVNPIFYELVKLSKERKFIPSPYVMASALSNIGVSGAMKIYDLGTDPDDSVARVAVLDIDRLMFIFSLNYKVQDVPMFAYDISFNENIQNITKDKDYKVFNTILMKMTGMDVSQLMTEANRIKREREQNIDAMSESISE